MNATPDSRTKHENYFSVITIVLIGILVIQSFCINAKSFGDASELIVMGTFLMNALLGCLMLWIAMKRLPYSLSQVQWIFFITFFVIAPLHQYHLQVWPWGYLPSDDQIVYVNILYFIWGFLFAVFSQGDLQLGSTGQIRENFQSIKLDLSRESWLALVMVTMGCTVATIVLVGPFNLFTRANAGIDMDSTAFSLLAYVLLRAGVFVPTLFILLGYKSDKKDTIGLTLCLLCTLIVCFPTALPRFNFAAIYGSIALILFPKIFKRKGVFALILVIGFLVVYPFLDAFKYILNSFSSKQLTETILNSMSRGYSTGNYDAYSVFFWVSDYTAKFGITYGRQLLGALLLFIPRSIWSTKPLPSGQEVFLSFDMPFTDIACPMPCEGYINFGVVGLAVFAVCYAFLVRKLDTEYWCLETTNKCLKDGVLPVFYPLFLFLSFYLLRGSLITTMTFVLGDLATVWLISNVILRLFSKKEKSYR